MHWFVTMFRTFGIPIFWCADKCYNPLWQDFFRTLMWWILPCFAVKLTREIFRFSHMYHESVWRACAVLFASVMSWMYLTTIVLSSCMLFNLVCNLQVIHFDDYGKVLEQDADPLFYLKEHLQLRHNLSKISHRFRMFLLLLFFSVTASQFAILYKTTAYNGPINFTNGGDIAVSSVVQVVGLVLCLHGAAKISHRAQNIASIASRWHALATCSSDSTYVSTPNSSGNLVPFPAHMFLRDYSESDLESLENGSTQGNSHNTAQLASYMSSYHKRESLVLYLLTNPGGITIFGWIVDRTFLNTILMFELTLVLFVLSKTIVIPTKTLVHSFLSFQWCCAISIIWSSVRRAYPTRSRVLEKVPGSTWHWLKLAPIAAKSALLEAQNHTLGLGKVGVSSGFFPLSLIFGNFSWTPLSC